MFVFEQDKISDTHSNNIKLSTPTFSKYKYFIRPYYFFVTYLKVFIVRIVCDYKIPDCLCIGFYIFFFILGNAHQSLSCLIKYWDCTWTFFRIANAYIFYTLMFSSQVKLHLGFISMSFDIFIM